MFGSHDSKTIQRITEKAATKGTLNVEDTALLKMYGISANSAVVSASQLKFHAHTPEKDVHAGGAIITTGQNLHGVLPIWHGERYSIIMFYDIL